MILNNKELPIKNPIYIMATCFGIGLIPLAPGTFGSLFGMLIFWLTVHLGQETQIIIAGLLLVNGIWVCGVCSKRLNIHDHSSIVWDEMSAMYSLLLFVPSTGVSLLAVFLLFRLFDIWKPWPINIVDSKVHGGVGIMLDDIMAGVAAIFFYNIISGLI